MKRFSYLLLAALAVVLAGCASGSTGEVVEIPVVTDAMLFDRDEIVVQKGQQFRLVLENRDGTEHDFTIAKIPGKLHKGDHGGGHGGPKVDLHVHADPLKTESIEFTPSKAGTYEFYCAVAGHKEAGMKGRLIVN